MMYIPLIIISLSISYFIYCICKKDSVFFNAMAQRKSIIIEFPKEININIPRIEIYSNGNNLVPTNLNSNNLETINNKFNEKTEEESIELMRTRIDDLPSYTVSDNFVNKG